MAGTHLETLLEEAEEARRRGDNERAAKLLRIVLRSASEDVARRSATTSTSAALPTSTSAALRAVAAYQLGSLLLQDASTAREGATLCWRLGFRLRLADDVLQYDRFLAGATAVADLSLIHI